MQHINFLGTQMNACTMRETVEMIHNRISNNQFTQHVVVNVAKLVNMQKDKTLHTAVESCDIINIDGMGVVWGARFLGKKVPERVAGIDLFYALISLANDKGYPVYLLGAKQEVVEIAAQKLTSQYQNLVLAGYHNGYFWENEQSVVNEIRKSGAKLLFVAITSPKKETFINKWKEQLGVDFVMGVGGTFDIVADKVKRSPKWMQETGLEWLFRTIQEPRRMWKRYLVTNSYFALLLIESKLYQFSQSFK